MQNISASVVQDKALMGCFRVEQSGECTQILEPVLRSDHISQRKPDKNNTEGRAKIIFINDSKKCCNHPTPRYSVYVN